MMAKSLFNPFTKNQLWHLVTVGGFIIGFALGWLVISSNTSRSALHLATFWAYPAFGAGLGMGICQWSIALRKRKNGYLWIPITTFGLIASVGATLTLTLAVSTYNSGIYDFAYDGLVAVFTPIAPFSLLIGPVSQWYLLQDTATGKSYKELIKIIAGWIFATSILFGMFYLVLKIGENISSTNDPNGITAFLILIIITIPSGLTFARTTINAIRMNQKRDST
jgi:hypothetical protein